LRLAIFISGKRYWSQAISPVRGMAWLIPS